MFPASQTSVVLGCIGLAESLSFAALGVLNSVIMSDDCNPNMFLIFFMTLAACSLVSTPVTWFTSEECKDRDKEDS